MMSQKHNPKFVVISNISFEPYLRCCLRETYGMGTVLASVHIAGLKESTSNETLRSADFIIVLINLDERFRDLTDGLRTGLFSSDDIADVIGDECRTIADYLMETTKSPVFWFSFEDYGIRERELFGYVNSRNNLVGRLNEALSHFNVGSINVLDLGYIIAHVGIEKSYDIRGKYRWNSPYSKELITEMVDGIDRQIRTLSGEMKKCIVVDCDNVLWGGIISEDGIDAIKLDGSGLGREYQDFQRYLKVLYDYGIILAVCSKNNSDDVMRMFREHNGMVLREEHISCFRVNWQNKAENIRGIAEELNIGLESMVFVDDSIFEIQSVRALLPEVSTILYNRNTIVSDISEYILLSDIVSYENSLGRQKTYIANRKRMKLRAECSTFEEYLDYLDTKIDIHIADETEINRISELTQRANQCTNGVRYSVKDLKERIEEGDSLYSVYVKDRYSELGLVGAMCFKQRQVALFVLSCRAIGRRIEDTMLDFAIKQGATTYVFLDTGKNSLLKTRIRQRFCIST